jgi:ABC-type sugar transport system substrate-binding protein/AraC-like DNA-binding protein
LCVVLVGCTNGERTYRIGVSQCSKGQWRDKVNQEMQAAQNLYEHSVKVSIANSYDDVDLQVSQIDSLVQTGIDLLVVAPNQDVASINQAIARVRQAGIPVICFDRKTSGNYTAFIGGNNKEAGMIVGDYVATLVDKEQQSKPLVIEITGDMTSTPAFERHQGFAQAMEQLPHVDYRCRQSDWSSDGACRIATEVIDSLRRTDSGRLDHTIIFCHNDGMATGVYKAVVEQDVEGRIKILGIDGMPGEGLEYVQFGHQVGTYVYPTHGEKIIRLALDILTGKPYERENPMLGFVVTPENVDLVAMESAELMEQNGNLVTIQDKLEEYFGLYNTQRKLLVGSIISIVLLVIAVITIGYAYAQARRAIRKRQALNEEQTLFYTHAAPQPLRPFLEIGQEDLPQPRSQDELFAEQLNAIIREKMANPSLKMDELGDAVGLSRVQLYRKVKAITGMTPVELLRQMRLQQGYVLLCNTTKTVQEIAYEVGFGTPGYFSKCFKQQYGKYPMELRT